MPKSFGFSHAIVPGTTYRSRETQSGSATATTAEGTATAHPEHESHVDPQSQADITELSSDRLGMVHEASEDSRPASHHTFGTSGRPGTFRVQERAPPLEFSTAASSKRPSVSNQTFGRPGSSASPAEEMKHYETIPDGKREVDTDADSQHSGTRSFPTQESTVSFGAIAQASAVDEPSDHDGMASTTEPRPRRDARQKRRLSSMTLERQGSRGGRHDERRESFGDRVSKRLTELRERLSLRLRGDRSDGSERSAGVEDESAAEEHGASSGK